MVDEKHYFGILALVSIVAVVGFVVMFTNKSSMSASSVEGVIADEAGNIGGEAIRSSASRIIRDVDIRDETYNLAEKCEWFYSDQVVSDDICSTSVVSSQCPSGDLVLSGSCSTNAMYSASIGNGANLRFGGLDYIGNPNENWKMWRCSWDMKELCNNSVGNEYTYRSGILCCSP